MDIEGDIVTERKVIEENNWLPILGNFRWSMGKNKKVGSTTYLFSLKLTNLTKPKLMKKNVIQIYVVVLLNCENNC